MCENAYALCLSEYATIASMVASEPKKFLGAYLTVVAEATSTSRKVRGRGSGQLPKGVREFAFK